MKKKLIIALLVLVLMFVAGCNKGVTGEAVKDTKEVIESTIVTTTTPVEPIVLEINSVNIGNYNFLDDIDIFIKNPLDKKIGRCVDIELNEIKFNKKCFILDVKILDDSGRVVGHESDVPIISSKGYLDDDTEFIWDIEAGASIRGKVHPIFTDAQGEFSINQYYGRNKVIVTMYDEKSNDILAFAEKIFTTQSQKDEPTYVPSRYDYGYDYDPYKDIVDDLSPYPNYIPKIYDQSEEIICSYNAYDCASFTNWKDANKVYKACGGIKNDVHNLDGDSDDIPCEELEDSIEGSQSHLNFGLLR